MTHSLSRNMISFFTFAVMPLVCSRCCRCHSVNCLVSMQKRFYSPKYQPFNATNIRQNGKISHKEKVTNQNSANSSHLFLYSDFNQIFRNKNNHKKYARAHTSIAPVLSHTQTQAKNQQKKHEMWNALAQKCESTTIIQ